MRNIIFAVVLMTVSATAARADDFANCAQDGNSDLKFAGCTALIAKHPRLAAAYSSRGSASAALGNADQAIADYSYALVLDATLVPAYYNRALLYLAGDDAALAADDFGQVVALDPKDATAYNGRGMAATAMGRFAAADVDFAMAIAIDPTYLRAYLGRANLNIQRSQFAAAIADYNKVLQLDTGNVDALSGRLFASNGARSLGSDTVGSISPLMNTPDAGHQVAESTTNHPGMAKFEHKRNKKARKSTLPAKTVAMQSAVTGQEGHCGIDSNEPCVVLSR